MLISCVPLCVLKQCHHTVALKPTKLIHVLGEVPDWSLDPGSCCHDYDFS
jgi:hypothetical protein